MSDFIPYGRHYIDQEDINIVESVLKGDWLTCGSSVDKFEEKLCQVTHSPFAVSCSNGTTALHMAMLALNIGSGDIVVVPAITFLATANAARFVGADVLFADVDPDTGLMTAHTLEQAIKSHSEPSKIKAVVNVHLNGQCGDLEGIQTIANKYNLFVIEDAAHAIGTHYINSSGEKQPVGSNKYAELTTFSFHPVKTIATGEGGAVTCKSTDRANHLKLARCHGMIRGKEGWKITDQGFDDYGNANPWYYEMQDLGYNYRISDINCALGMHQLTKLQEFKQKRQKMVDIYDTAFQGHPHIAPLKKLSTSDTCWHLYVIKINFQALGKSRAQVMNNLNNEGIGTQVHYMPLYRQPYYSNLYGVKMLPGSESYYASCLSIPLYVGLKEEQQQRIIKIIKAL